MEEEIVRHEEFDNDRTNLIQNPESRNNDNESNSDGVVSDPKDRYYFCHFTFFVIGVCQLLPWNFLLNATNYWMYKFEDPGSDHSDHSWKGHWIIKFFHLSRTPHGHEKNFLQIVFESYLAIASNAPFLLVFALGFFISVRCVSDRTKNVVLFILMFFVFGAITAFVPINTDSFQLTFLYITLVLVFLLNMCSIFVQANFAALASLLPNSIMHSMVTGQAVSGMFAVSTQIFIIITNFPLITSTFIYFTFACFVILFTLIVYLAANRTKYFKYYESLKESHEAFQDDDQKDDYFGVFRAMLPYCLSLMLNFVVTLSLIPAIMVLVIPDDESSIFNQKYFIPIACFFVFAAGDFLGRLIGGYYILPRARKGLLLCFALLRILLIPLLMHCNLNPRHYMAIWFPSQYAYIALNLILGLSNGYVTVNAFVNGPLSVPVEHRKLCGFFLMLFLGLGLTLGSFLSTFLVRIL